VTHRRRRYQNAGVTSAVLDGVREGRLERPDGRTVAWTNWGPPDGLPLLRVPGTPGSRYNLRPDRTEWEKRGLRAITTERPGYGASTPLPGRGFNEHADDLAAILDQLGLDAVHLIGGSGAAPHELAFAARHPDRVRAMTVLVGAAPVTDEEAAGEIGLNRVAYGLVTSGDVEGLRALLTEQRAAMLADPLAAITQIMDKAPPSDQEVMRDPGWREAFAVSAREALQQGIEGWTDEALALIDRWDDIDLSGVRTSLTWWHAAGDANAPLSAAQRLLQQVPHAQLRLFGADEGHMAPYHREPEILDELLARG
jgi:pimeloyl-ACP methyl ester carboxylesterase